MAWTQVYDPLHSWILSTLVAALPILVLFGLLAGLRVKPHWCAMAGAGTAVVVAVTIFGMPFPLAAMSFVYGVGFGVLKIAWIVLAAVYLYDVSVHTGQFEIMKESVAGITADRRLQLLLVAFCFGAFIEGAAGFGAPVAIAGAFMIGLGFQPFHAAALNLLANTSPVAWGAIGTPRSEEHTSELQSQSNLVCRLLLEKKKKHNILLDVLLGHQRVITDTAEPIMTTPHAHEEPAAPVTVCRSPGEVPRAGGR